MSEANPAISDEMIDALLAQDGVQELIKQTMQENGVDIPFEELPRESRAILLKALITDGIIQVGGGRELSADEFLAILEAEEAAEAKEEDPD